MLTKSWWFYHTGYPSSICPAQQPCRLHRYEVLPYFVLSDVSVPVLPIVNNYYGHLVNHAEPKWLGRLFHFHSDRPIQLRQGTELLQAIVSLSFSILICVILSSLLSSSVEGGNMKSRGFGAPRDQWSKFPLLPQNKQHGGSWLSLNLSIRFSCAMTKASYVGTRALGACTKPIVVGIYSPCYGVARSVLGLKRPPRRIAPGRRSGKS